MTWRPISGIVPQATANGNQSNGYVWKFYEVGTTTPLTVATSATGATTTTEFVLDSAGYSTLSGNRVIPHVDSAYKVVLYLNQADADANDTGSAVYVIDNIEVSDLEVASYKTLADAIAGGGSVGDFVRTAEYTADSGIGGATYKIVSSAPSYLTTLNHAKTDGSGNYLEIVDFDGAITKSGCKDDTIDYSQNIEDSSALAATLDRPINIDIEVKMTGTAAIVSSVEGDSRIYGDTSSFFSTSTDDISISGVEVEGTLASGTLSQVLIEATDCDGLTVKNCKLTNVRTRHRNQELATHKNFRFENNLIVCDSTNFDYATQQIDVITVRGIDGVWIDNNTIEVTNVHRVMKIADTEGNVDPDEVSAYRSKNISIKGNNISGSTLSSKQVLDMFSGCQNIDISGNYIDVTGFNSVFQNKTGIKQDFDQNLQITNNPLIRNDNVTISLQGSYGASTAAHVGGYQNAKITGNTIENTSSSDVEIIDVRFYNYVDITGNDFLDGGTGDKYVEILGNEVCCFNGNYIPDGSVRFNTASTNSAGDPFAPDILRITACDNVIPEGLNSLQGQIAIRGFTSTALDLVLSDNQLDTTKTRATVSGAILLRDVVGIRNITCLGNSSTMTVASDARILIQGTTTVTGVFIEDNNTWNDGVRNSALNNIAAQENLYGKYEGKMYYNTDANKPVYAQGATAGSVWADAVGTTVNTPV